MLDLSNWSQLGGLIFAARRLVEGLWAGRHPSIRQGSGLDFHDYRIYTPGDDPAQVDWKLFGRTDRYFVRRYQQQTDLNATILVDCSASMDFAKLDPAGRSLRGAKVMSKLRCAQLLAAAIAFLTIRQGDRAGVGLFADKLIEHIPPASTWAHLKRLCSVLERAQPRGQGDLGAALRQAHALRSRRGLLVILSDLLDEPQPFFDGLSRFRHDHFDVIVFQILSQQELRLAGIENARLQLIDSETKQRLPSDLRLVSDRYRQLMQDHLAALRRGCQARRVDHNLVLLDEPATAALRRYVQRRR
jgi:uncharacterized protein (DUF58 family)